VKCVQEKIYHKDYYRNPKINKESTQKSYHVENSGHIRRRLHLNNSGNKAIDELGSITSALEVNFKSKKKEEEEGEVISTKQCTHLISNARKSCQVGIL
jgi:hypothetical protein